MSEQSADTPPDAQPADDETTLSAGVAGPSGTGELTDAGADPSAPASPAHIQESPAHMKEQA